MNETNIADLSSGFRDLLGIRWCGMEDGAVVLELPIRPDHLNFSGTVHGGVIMSLIDIACGLAVMAPAPSSRTPRSALTLSLTTSFTGQAQAGTVRVIGRQRAGGRKIVFATAEVFNAHGALIALGEGTFRYHTPVKESDS
jgi:uncharacterized protein (TIGR00369 family)